MNNKDITNRKSLSKKDYARYKNILFGSNKKGVITPRIHDKENFDTSNHKMSETPPYSGYEREIEDRIKPYEPKLKEQQELNCKLF